jgi:hypothetical protein
MRLVLAVLLILTSPVALAITVEGEGSSLQQALNNAFKVAIDNEVGVILDTERHSKNGEIVHNQILSYSAGYITSYTILHHIHVIDRNIHQVNVDVTVASSKLKNFLLSSNHNPLAFNMDNIKAQIRLYKEGYVDGQKLLDNTLKYFPREAFNVQVHNFNIVADYHNTNKHYLHVPYTITWDQRYLVALQELLTLFEGDRTGRIYASFGDERVYITDQMLFRKLRKVFGRSDFVLLNINSLLSGISINTCVQSIRYTPGKSWDSKRALYTYTGGGLSFKNDREVSSFLMYPINEQDLQEFQGLTELTLRVSSTKNCPENSIR